MTPKVCPQCGKDSSSSDSSGFCSINCRYESQLQREPGQLDGCWLWTGHSEGDRGARAYFRSPGQRVEVQVYSWRRSGKSLPKGSKLVNICGKPMCVNPDHLKLKQLEVHATIAQVVGVSSEGIAGLDTYQLLMLEAETIGDKLFAEKKRGALEWILYLRRVASHIERRMKGPRSTSPFHCAKGTQQSMPPMHYAGALEPDDSED